KLCNGTFGDNRLTSALVDRLVPHARIIAFTGESYRLRNALSSGNTKINIKKSSCTSLEFFLHFSGIAACTKQI
ncbi:ATP-binding protein, partial [Bacillus thuringiensis]|uniref:ATP-binding protein n=1 Tax=Bacillus thuringiensis TaxID=1428 RepID=UPI00211D2A7C